MLHKQWLGSEKVEEVREVAGDFRRRKEVWEKKC
jgi:hypothetical protein